MKSKISDRHLDVPAEANRDKHINFTALENNQADPSDEQVSRKLNEERVDEKLHNKTKNKEIHHQKLTDNPRHATDEASSSADSPRDRE
jgi:hypothetical protein